MLSTPYVNNSPRSSKTRDKVVSSVTYVAPQYETTVYYFKVKHRDLPRLT